ncbi:hypothetical protein Tco_0120645 [Tanacetum coccineum]
MLVIKRFSERKKVFRERKKTGKIRAKRMVVKEIKDGLLEEIEKFGWWFEQDIDGENEDVITEYLVNISKRHAFWSLKEDILKITVLTTNTPYPSRKIRRIAASGLRPYHFTYHERRLTMEEMLYKFIDEGKGEHEEMRAFICDFQTTNEILFKERNNSLIELRFGVQELLKVINNTPTIDCEVKRVTTRGGKTTTQDA